jgi:phage terminase small subunit
MPEHKGAKKGKLTHREELLAQEYLVDLNITRAGIRAGYSPKWAHKAASRAFLKPEVQERVQELFAQREQRTQITQDYILKNLRAVAERCMQIEPVLDRKGEQVWVETPDGQMAPAYTFQAQAANKSLELLGKHLGMFSEKHDVNLSGGITINIVHYGSNGTS